MREQLLKCFFFNVLKGQAKTARGNAPNVAFGHNQRGQRQEARGQKKIYAKWLDVWTEESMPLPGLCPEAEAPFGAAENAS